MTPTADLAAFLSFARWRRFYYGKALCNQREYQQARAGFHRGTHLLPFGLELVVVIQQPKQPYAIYKRHLGQRYPLGSGCTGWTWLIKIEDKNKKDEKRRSWAQGYVEEGLAVAMKRRYV